MSVTYPTKIILAFRSGGICAYPACGKSLAYEADAGAGADASIAEAAHICGEKSEAARYDASMTDEERDRIDNLIYLCPSHHTVIDKVPADWPTHKLRALKAEHEERASQAMEAAFADVAFPELKQAVSWVNAQAPATNASFEIVPPDEKIKKNQLSGSSRHIIAAGLAARKTVSQYVEAEAHHAPDFPERLKAGFLAEYYSLRNKPHVGDELFELMCSFAQRGMSSQATKTAGLAVLVYLFEVCDVFEK